MVPSDTIPSHVATDTNVHRADNCYCCPYGGMHVIPGILSGFALFLTFVGSSGCTFLSLSGSTPILDVLDLTTNSSIRVGAGIWYFENVNAVGSDTTVCVEYPGTFQPDTALSLVRLFSSISSLGGIAFFVMLLIAACKNFAETKYMMVVAAGFFSLSLICMLLLAFLASDLCVEASECEIGGNAKIVIIASLLWLLSGASTVMLKPKPLEQSASLELPYVPHSARSPSTAFPRDDRSTASTELDQDEVPGLPSTRMT